MAVHDFNFAEGDDRPAQIQPPNAAPINQTTPDLAIEPTRSPSVVATPANSDSRDDLHYTVDNKDDRIDLNFHEEVREVQVPGFHKMDTAIKTYFSGIRVPVFKGNEQYRMLNVRMSGSDPSSLVYADKSMVGGRLQLPFMAITRTAENPDPSRYTPANLPWRRIYLNNGKRMEYVYRPVPYLIDYTLEIWGSHKRDVENALYSIKSRFNPLASFYLAEQGVTYEVVMHTTGSSDAGDIESDADAHAEVRRSITVQLEGWLPLPTKVVPTILAKPVSIKEGLFDALGGLSIPGETYTVIKDNS